MLVERSKESQAGQMAVASRIRARANPETMGDVAGDGRVRTSSRLQYMGATPDKYSRTGQAVVERMRVDGQIIGDGPLLRGNPNNLQLVGPGGTLTRIDSKVDMAHTVDAVSWWNEVGRFYAPKAPEVRQFMLSSENYVLQPSSINRSEGARLGQTYQSPAVPDFTKLKR